MPKQRKISVSLKLSPDQKGIFDDKRAEHDLTQQQYLLNLVLLDTKFGLITSLGEPTEDKFVDDDFAQFAARVEAIKPVFDSLINAEQLQEKLDSILTYLTPVTVEQEDPVAPPVTSEVVEPVGASVTEGQVDPVQQAAIDAAKPTLPGNPAGLLPGNALNPPTNPHAVYAEIGLGQVNLEKMRQSQVSEARAEIAERKKILEGLGIGGDPE